MSWNSIQMKLVKLCKNFNLTQKISILFVIRLKKIKGISGEKKRISERIRKAREGNKLNLDVVVNIKNMDNVKILIILSTKLILIEIRRISLDEH